MNFQKKIQFVIIFFFCWNCILFSKKGAVPGPLKDSEFQMVEKYKGTFNVKGEGPMKLSCNKKPCTPEDLALLRPFDPREFRKDGYWIEYAQKEDEKKNKYSVKNISGIYKDGTKEGIWLTYFQTGEVLRETPYKEGMKSGIEKKYNLKGKLIEETTYAEDKKNGGYWKNFPNGDHLAEEGFYKDDLKSGKWTIYYAIDKDRVKKKETEFALDKRNGYEINYFESGGKSSEGTFKDDLKNGYWKFYYKDNNVVQMEGSYEICKPKSTENRICGGTTDPEGKEELKIGNNDHGLNLAKIADGKIKVCKVGLWKEYFPNGKLFATGTRNHVRIGQWSFFDNNGLIRFKGEMANEVMMKKAEVYEKGVLQGSGTLFFSIVKIDEKTENIKDSFRPSMPYIYYKDGKKEFEIARVYRKGANECDPNEEFIGIQYDKDGNKIGEGPIVPGGRKKDGCWTLLGAKKYFIMDHEPENPKLAEMLGCK